MNRRSFMHAAAGVAAGVAASSLLLPGITVASQASTPVPTDAIYLRDTTDLPALRFIAYRSFDASDRFTFPEGMQWLRCFGMIFSTPEDAADSMEAFAAGLWKRDGLTVDPGWEVGDRRPANMRSMGDASSAWTWIRSNPDSDTEWTQALTLVVQDRWMQGLYANSPFGNPVSALADLAEPTLRRWPNETRTNKRNGMWSGGFWDMMPKLTDMPEGVSLTRESGENGPFEDTH